MFVYGLAICIEISCGGNLKDSCYVFNGSFWGTVYGSSAWTGEVMVKDCADKSFVFYSFETETRAANTKLMGLISREGKTVGFL